jgi:hypothetical protein
MFSKKKASGKGNEKAKESQDVKISLDTLETESVAEQLREIEAKKAKEKKKS